MNTRSALCSLAASCLPCPAVGASTLSVRFDAATPAEPLSDRLLILGSNDDSAEARDRMTWGLSTVPSPLGPKLAGKTYIDAGAMDDTRSRRERRTNALRVSVPVFGLESRRGRCLPCVTRPPHKRML